MFKRCCYTTLPSENICGPRVLWEITSKCNFGCKFCSLQYDQHEDINTEQCYKIIETLKAFGIYEILLAGREPMMRPDIMHIIEKIDKEKIMLSISTNGSFPEKLKECLCKYTNIRAVNLSLDSYSTAVHDQLREFNGSFSRIVHFLKSNQFNTKIKVNITITPVNLSHLEKTVNFLSKLGVNFISISPISSISEKGLGRYDCLSSNQLDELMDKYIAVVKKLPKKEIHFILPNQCGLKNNEHCYAGRKLIAILSDGSLAPCNILAHMSSRYIFGNILRGDVVSIWHRYQRLPDSHIFAQAGV